MATSKPSQTRPEKPEIFESEDKNITTGELADVIASKLNEDQFAVIHAPGSQTPNPNPVAILPKKVNHPLWGEEKVNNQFATYMRKLVDKSNPYIKAIVTKAGLIKETSKDYKDALMALKTHNQLKLRRLTTDEEKDRAIIDLIKGKTA